VNAIHESLLLKTRPNLVTHIFVGELAFLTDLRYPRDGDNGLIQPGNEGQRTQYISCPRTAKGLCVGRRELIQLVQSEGDLLRETDLRIVRHEPFDRSSLADRVSDGLRPQTRPGDVGFDGGGRNQDMADKPLARRDSLYTDDVGAVLSLDDTAGLSASEREGHRIEFGDRLTGPDPPEFATLLGRTIGREATSEFGKVLSFAEEA
jgi:hypothetical protein